jgi:hypothetical protein
MKSWNQIDNEGAKYISMSILHFNCLKAFALNLRYFIKFKWSQNKIGDVGAKFLIVSLEKLALLTKFEF